MRGAVFALVLVVVPAAVAVPTARAENKDDGLDVRGREAADLRGDALVWEDATFYLEPWTGGASVRFESLHRGRREDVGRAIPVRIIESSSMRRFVEIELPQGVDCAVRRVGLEPRVEALRLYVQRDDLAPVLVKPYSVAYADGTGVRLAAGVPVVPTASGLYAISVRDDRLYLPIPHTSVGYLYKRGKVTEPSRPTGAQVRLDRIPTVKLGGTAIEVRSPWLAPDPRGARSPKPGTPAEQHVLRWSTKCIDLSVSAPSSALRPATWSALQPPRESSPPAAPRGYRVLRGTPLFTVSGREVAAAGELLEVAAPNGDVACFDARLSLFRVEDPPRGSLYRTVKLCAAAGHVIGVPAATPATATTTKDHEIAPPDVAEPPPNTLRTAKGVWYRVLAPSKSHRRPKATDTVVVHYTGWTTDGRMFDSSHTRGQAATFPLANVIPGWTDGLQIMTIGMKARFWIPEELAYKGAPGPPAGMLVFDVELLDIP